MQQLLAKVTEKFLYIIFSQKPQFFFSFLQQMCIVKTTINQTTSRKIKINEMKQQFSSFFRKFSRSTDLCSSEQLPEVEIFSLLEEQIPKYKIRADCLTEFAGCENQVSTEKVVIK
jgi:hypothetical protein